MTDDPWKNDDERRLREASFRPKHRGEGPTPEPPPKAPAAEPKGQDRLAAAYSDTGTLTPTRRRKLAAKADALDHPGTPELAALAARLDADPSLWHRLGASTRVQLGLYAESVRARQTLDTDDGPSAA